MKKSIAIFFAVLLVFAATAQAKVLTKSVPYQHNGMQLEGFLAYDDSIKGKRPGILVVHEWWGLNDYARGRAEQLAAMGYVAFALDMYGVGKVTGHADQAGAWMKQITQNLDLWRSRAMAGMRILTEEPTVDQTRIAAIGYCFGGATVQQIAYSGADVRGVVSFHGSPILPPENAGNVVKAKILICHGGNDPFVKDAHLQNYLAEMRESGLDWQMVIYGGAKHSFTNPDADKAGMDALKYDKAADQRSWSDMKAFFDEIFGAR
ncbi:MAG: dienelactone hydrolase family protein [Desulfobacteraceae bacterium]